MEDLHEFIQATGSFSLGRLSVHMSPIRPKLPIARSLEARFNQYSLPSTTIIKHILASSTGLSALFDKRDGDKGKRGQVTTSEATSNNARGVL
jgi:hypothetical protein